jgi:thiamine kinase
MVAPLPPAVARKLEQALSQWQRWSTAPTSPPQPLEIFVDGISNTSVHVGDGLNSWVVRVDGFDPRRIGLSRSAEWRALQQAASLGLAPNPVYTNPELGILVCEYHAPDATQQSGAAELEDVAHLLRAIHALPPVKFRLDPLARAQRYLQLAAGGELESGFLQACKRLSLRSYSPVLCHNDLLKANRLRCQGKLLALDWEYAAVGDPLFDLAVIIEGDGLNDAQTETLLCSWLDTEAREEDRHNLADNRLVYRELSRLWGNTPKNSS